MTRLFSKTVDPENHEGILQGISSLRKAGSTSRLLLAQQSVSRAKRLEEKSSAQERGCDRLYDKKARLAARIEAKRASLEKDLAAHEALGQKLQVVGSARRGNSEQARKHSRMGESHLGSVRSFVKAATFDKTSATRLYALRGRIGEIAVEGHTNNAGNITTTVSFDATNVRINDGRGGVLPYDLPSLRIRVTHSANLYGDSIDAAAYCLEGEGHKCAEIDGECSYYAHPHIGSDGTVCLGSARDDLIDAFGAANYTEVAVVMAEFLASYNAEDPYCSLDHWGPNPFDNRRFCYSCATTTEFCGCSACSVCGESSSDRAVLVGGACEPCRANTTPVLNCNKNATIVHWRYA